MTKISELLAGREKLAKYDELTKWKNCFSMPLPPNALQAEYWERWKNCFSCMPLPPLIKEIIVSAIDAEIKKLDEE